MKRKGIEESGDRRYPLRSAFALLLLMVFALSSCGDEKELTEELLAEEGQTAVTVALDTRSGGEEEEEEELECKMYIYRKKTSKETSYILEEIVSLDNREKNTVVFEKQYLNAEYSYRFLFTAFTLDPHSLSVTGAYLGRKWEDIRLSSSNLRSSHFFYDVSEMSGSDIASKQNINAKLNFLVGDWAIDIYKPGGTSDEVWSVFDRVVSYHCSVSCFPSIVKFDNELNLIQEGIITDDYGFGANYSNSIEFRAQDQFKQKFRASPSRSPYITGGEEAGSVRLQGFYGIPVANTSLEVKITCDYLDPTPICGLSHNDHEEGFHLFDCFEKRTIVLNLPGESAETPISILPGKLTVIKVAIPGDYVWETTVNGDQFTLGEFDTSWNY